MAVREKPSTAVAAADLRVLALFGAALALLVVGTYCVRRPITDGGARPQAKHLVPLAVDPDKIRGVDARVPAPNLTLAVRGLADALRHGGGRGLIRRSGSAWEVVVGHHLAVTVAGAGAGETVFVLPQGPPRILSATTSEPFDDNPRARCMRSEATPNADGLGGSPPPALVGYRTVTDGTVSAAAVVRSVKRYATLDAAAAAAGAEDKGTATASGQQHIILYGGDHNPVYFRVTVDAGAGADSPVPAPASSVVTVDPDGSGRVAYVPAPPPM
jgi:hypothetical protein